jgi:transcriptional regulator with XRE-family HTH domain
MAAPDALRGYLRELRDRQHISQKDLADRIGLSLRAFVDWETGKTEDLKGSLLVQAIKEVGASWKDIESFTADSTFDDGRAAALRWFAHQHLTVQDAGATLIRAAADHAPDQQAEAAALLRRLADLIETGEVELAQLLAAKQ